MPSGQSRVYRVTQLRTDGVHCRVSAGTGPVTLKVIPVWFLLRYHYGPFFARLFLGGRASAHMVGSRSVKLKLHLFASIFSPKVRTASEPTASSRCTVDCTVPVLGVFCQIFQLVASIPSDVGT